MEAVRAGGDRQELHEAIRDASMEAWDALARGEDNPLSRLLAEDARMTALFDPAEIRRLLDPSEPRRRRAAARAAAGRPHRRPAAVPRARSESEPDVNKGIEIARGKTKVLYEKPGQPHQLVVAQIDKSRPATARGATRSKARAGIAAQTTARVFRLLNLCGLPTHYLSGGEDDDDNEMLVRRAQHDSARSRDRGVAAGSFVKRKPGIARGAILVPRVVEFFFKDDANHDPLIEPDEIVARRHRDAARGRRR